MTTDQAVVAVVLAAIVGGAIGLALGITWILNQALALIHRHRR